MNRWLFVLLTVFAPLAADIAYEVRFVGIEDAETEELLRSASQLILLQDCPPATAMALQRRAEAEIEHLITTLHSRAYFDAKITLNIDQRQDSAQVIFNITTGPVYPLVAFRLAPHLSEEEGAFVAYDDIDLADLGITLGAPAYPQTILDGEDALIDLLDNTGYPFAKVVKREVIADQQSKQVEVALYVQSGPLAYFGDTDIIGLKHVRESFVRRKIAWAVGDPYDPAALQNTFNALDNSRLFLNIQLKPGECIEGDNRVPLHIELSEARHRSIALGGSYQTQQGGGVIGEWEHRNIRGVGERVAVKTELMWRLQSGSVTYTIPDFLQDCQELTSRAEAWHEVTEGFHDTSASIASRLTRRFSCTTLGSGGGALKYLTSSDSDNNSDFILAKVPLQLIYNNTGCPLDPKQGASLNIKFTPTFQVKDEQLNYYILTMDGALYRPFDAEENLIIATKLSLGSIMGASRFDIPPPERLYAGSPQLLRGYRYMTVSPLDADHKPIGGRSLAVLSLELRKRLGEDWGTVLFYEVGNVYAATLPDFKEKQLQSAGFGIRYYTPVGPLSVDVAFPLNRRPHVDGPFQVYFNIGQTF
jgi:translocation and assembly module TamA